MVLGPTFSSVYYLFYTIRYYVQIKFLTGDEKDYQSMMTHHISTVLLLTLSFRHYYKDLSYSSLDTSEKSKNSIIRANLSYKF